MVAWSCLGDKGPKLQHCKIVLLDDTDLIQAVQRQAKGNQLLEVVFKHLNLLETAYFGLRYVDAGGQTHWLDPTKRTLRQLKVANTSTLYFGVKFYAADPCKLLEEITRYQFFLQVKQDILHGRLSLPFDLAAELFAYALQSELGDYDSRRHLQGYPNEFSFAPNQTADLVSKAADLHKELVGKVPAAAELSFLDRVKWLDMYGVDLHMVLGRDNIEYYLGLTPSGILVIRNRAKVGNYFWPRITKITFKGKFFMLRVRGRNNEENTYGFELPSKQACKHLWKCSVEHHAFFRLTQVNDLPRNHGKFFSLGSKFRYSGRTQKQVEAEFRTPPRPPPSVVRVPSRRYQRRQPDGADATVFQAEDGNLSKSRDPSEWHSIISIPQPVQSPSSMYRCSSVPMVLPLSDSPKSTRSAPWENPKQKGLYSQSANPSPRSIRSFGSQPRHRRISANDSDHGSECRRRRRNKHLKSSDNESETSRGSRSSRHGRKHRCKHQDNSGSDSDFQHKQKRRSRRLNQQTGQPQPDEEWQKVTYISQSRAAKAVVRDLGAHKSGYVNSGIDTESEAAHLQNRKHRRRSRSRSKSPESMKMIPEEVKRHIMYKLVDSTTLTEEEKKNIQYTKVEADNRLFKIRYSPSTGRPRYKVSKIPPKEDEVTSRTATKVTLPRLIASDYPAPPSSENMAAVKPTSVQNGGGIRDSTLEAKIGRTSQTPKVTFQPSPKLARVTKSLSSDVLLHKSRNAHEMSTEL